MLVFTNQESCGELRDCINQTKRIHWELGPLFTSIEDRHFEYLDNYVQSHRFEYQKRVLNTFHKLSSEDALQLDVSYETFVCL